MGVLSEVPATVEVPINSLSAAGLAIAMWEAARRKDQTSGSLVMLTAEPGELVGSGAVLLVHLLRRAGHHHLDAHEEVRDGTLPEHFTPFTEPWLSNECPAPDLAGPACGCDVETAARLLTKIVADTPAADPLTQIADQFAADRDRTTLALVNVNVTATTVLIEAAALLVAHRWGGTAADVLHATRSQILLDVAA